MSAPLRASVLDLLRQSFSAWQIDAQLSVRGTEIVVTSGQAAWIINAAPSGLPFRWLVHDGARRHTAASVVGLLRILRIGLDSSYQPATLRVGAPQQ